MQEAGRIWDQKGEPGHPRQGHAGCRSQLGQNRRSQQCDERHGRGTIACERSGDWGSLKDVSGGMYIEDAAAYNSLCTVRT